MKIDKETVEKIAHLSRLSLTEEEKKKSIQELSEILSFMEKLNEVDVEGVSPLIHLNDEVNVLREDIEKQELTREEALQNAPLKNEEYFKVSKVINK
ncbi:aspartyl/glutamyl-tRNA(Asn/Gln) amidotransferase subunit C [Pseudopedobacter saltans DSM 12145]|uniref:Aspartyl/glutamyl-tRNA(Asn/Gln) amidotransferase subunit C n=1 Tax=Pseudopedobacter saltans (strain ATCC 51119 / DSM 12145 / JCM 21818 / CCUG 39354 / LMG 10337 / NBRC 100064 / NCIMB 13643) TaxID=762903 RepID=F0S7X9_PSESL|nr:Asp-tRNA(Asn)/Glu-tRNA(Gln) amidotransferase subunit GatC [Pseudopedobacter saltans]ADY51200.1 aspartyl/glutamyl-tRNA(Asn/Gln) amidotransferase subunit C [Pseudopedobacter saltans DSM 12145]